MTAGGKLFELATWEHRIDESECSSLDIDEESMLRTPSAIEGGGGANSAAMKKAKGRMVMVRDQMADLAAANGLPTSPVIADDARRYDVVNDLFFTPLAIDGGCGARSAVRKIADGRMPMLQDQIADLAAVNGLKTTETIQADAERYDAAGSLLPTPTAVQARNATSGRQPGSQHHAGTTLHDLVFDGSLLPTPTVGHIRNNDEPIEEYMARRAKGESGEYRGMPGISLGVAVRMETETELLPTVKARDAIAEGYEAGLRRQSPQIGTIAKGITDGDERVLMPTPKAADGTNGNLKTSEERKAAGFFVDLPNVAVDLSRIELMGTPRVSMANGESSSQVNSGAPKGRIEDQVLTTKWGKYEPAIRRWERVLNRLAPAPTRPDGKDGAHRLNPEFTEWMMGLPAGWITGQGLKRNDELKMAGNGVCPQQAYHAVSNLLIDMMTDLKDD
jgi:hypothetical protein